MSIKPDMKKELVNNVVIWGTGRMGVTAYFYYRDICNVCGYIDNDERKWGMELNGVNIYSPSELKDLGASVVIAMKGGADSVVKQLRQEYGIEQYVLFSAESQECSFSEQLADSEIDEDTCIVHLGGGLGNQMFQYAFYKVLQLSGKTVLAYLNDFNTPVCYLMQAFKGIDLVMCTEGQVKSLIEKNIHGYKGKKFILYIEENINEADVKIADTSIVNASGGIFQGLFQTYKFAESVKDFLLRDFVFKVEDDNGFQKIQDAFVRQNTVSVHIRRGDYLTENNRWIYGDICTDEYYEKAMVYVREVIGECFWIFFSNDIEWVKEHYQREDALYIESDMFEDYHDWYDMYLMSICKHNIIANSTFSWWGAWLNQNEEKIVIAPKRWVNLCDYKDIYPKEWIIIS